MSPNLPVRQHSDQVSGYGHVMKLPSRTPPRAGDIPKLLPELQIPPLRFSTVIARGAALLRNPRPHREGHIEVSRLAPPPSNAADFVLPHSDRVTHPEASSRQ